MNFIFFGYFFQIVNYIKLRQIRLLLGNLWHVLKFSTKNMDFLMIFAPYEFYQCISLHQLLGSLRQIGDCMKSISKFKRYKQLFNLLTNTQTSTMSTWKPCMKYHPKSKEKIFTAAQEIEILKKFQKLPFTFSMFIHNYDYQHPTIICWNVLNSDFFVHFCNNYFIVLWANLSKSIHIM